MTVNTLLSKMTIEIEDVFPWKIVDLCIVMQTFTRGSTSIFPCFYRVFTIWLGGENHVFHRFFPVTGPASTGGDGTHGTINYPPVSSNIWWLENGPFIVDFYPLKMVDLSIGMFNSQRVYAVPIIGDFPCKTSIPRGSFIAMFDYQKVVFPSLFRLRD